MSDIAPKSGEFQEGKLWFQRKGFVLTVGLTNSAVEDVGSVEKLSFPEQGDDFDKGEIIATVDGSHGKIEVIAPTAGIIQEVNEAALDEPERVTEDPLEEGWLFKFEVEDTSELKEWVVKS